MSEVKRRTDMSASRVRLVGSVSAKALLEETRKRTAETDYNRYAVRCAQRLRAVRMDVARLVEDEAVDCGKSRGSQIDSQTGFAIDGLVSIGSVATRKGSVSLSI